MNETKMDGERDTAPPKGDNPQQRQSGCRPAMTVIGRSLHIPPALQYIAVENDRNSQSVDIFCPRRLGQRDLSQCGFFLRTVNSRGEYDAVALFPKVLKDRLQMQWVLCPPQTSCSGKLTLQLWATGKDFDWQTAEAPVYIIRQLAGKPAIPTEPSALDAFLTRLTELAAAAEKSGNEAGEAAAEAAAAAEQAAEAEKRIKALLYRNAWNGKRMTLQEILDFIFTLILRYHSEGICWADWDALELCWDTFELLSMTWDQFEIWKGEPLCM
ncbi:MAG: hypothetical protein HFG27_09030 [Provencibacterium sp.]|jgi:hypothetical protein|nr:hypothetical protein [Provencibacterium sp.]